MSLRFIFGIALIISSCTISYGAESRARIALLDTGYPILDRLEPVKNYLCEDGHVDLTHTYIGDTNGHSTSLIYIISKYINPNKACITVIKTYSPPIVSYVEGIRYAVKIGAKYINMSAGGVENDRGERYAILEAIARKTHFVVAAGNNAHNLSVVCDYYPACYAFQYSHFHVIGNGLNGNTRAYSSNYGGPITDWEQGNNHCECPSLKCMSGTSQSAAVFTGKLVQKELR